METKVDNGEANFLAPVNNGNRFDKDWQFYRGLTAIAYGISRRDLRKCFQGFQLISLHFHNKIEEIHSKYRHPILDNEFENELRSFFSMQRLPYTRKLLCLYCQGSQNPSKYLPTDFQHFPANWEFKLGGNSHIADLIPNNGTPYQLKSLKRDNIQVIAWRGFSIGDAFFAAFPKIREFSLMIPEIMGSVGISPIDEVLSGKKSSRISANLEILCDKWMQKRAPRDDNHSILGWGDIKLAKYIGQAVVQASENNKHTFRDDPFLRFYLLNPKRKHDVTYKVFPSCSEVKEGNRVPTKRWGYVLKAICKEDLKKGQRSDVSEAFIEYFSVRARIFDKTGKLIISTSVKRLPPTEFLKQHKRAFRRNYVEFEDEANIDNGETDDNDDLYISEDSSQEDPTKTEGSGDKMIEPKFHENSTE
jgi:hypothetical protein